MELFILLMLLATGAYTLKSRDQNRRIALLSAHLGKHQIEKLMESLTEGYLRALGEDDPERRAQIWSFLSTAELTLCEQFNRFVAEFARVNEADARVSKLSQDEVNEAVYRLNHRPRKCLGYRTPHEVFYRLKMTPLKLPTDALCS
jgi:hypothetical protein